MLRKKGDPTDMLIVVIFIFVLAIGFLVYYYFTTVTADALEQTVLNINETQEGIQVLRELGSQGAANGFLMLFGALVLGVIITAFLVKVHPVFLFMYIIFLLITIMVAAFLGNAYAGIVALSPFDDLAAQQPVIDAIMRNIVRISLAIGALSMIVVFAKIFGSNDSAPAGGGGV